MTKAPPKHSRGRHARPPSQVAARWNRMVTSPSRASGRRRLIAVGTGTASIVLLATAVGLSSAGGRDAPSTAVAASGKPAAKPSAEASSTADPEAVPEAVPYFESKDTDRKVVKHVEDVRRSGEFVRVYTDLGEGDENSGPAVSLCEWTTKLLEEGGDTEPRVFVHGKSDGNGSVVLANKQSDKDDCEVGETR